MRAPPPPLAPVSGNDAARRGMVLWLTLVAMFLFVALAVYVFNIGRHVERQEATQDTADAAAIGAASEMARSLNQVAMNNVEMARMVVAAQILDSMPQATAYTLADQRAIQRGVDGVTAQGLAGQYGAIVNSLVTSSNVKNDLTTQVTCLQGMARNFWPSAAGDVDAAIPTLCLPLPPDTTPNVRNTTWYAPPGGDKGSLWKGIEALDKLSKATLEQLPLTAELGATVSAEKNQGTQSGTEKVAGASPFRLQLPWQHGTFDDFYNPVIKGTLPDVYGESDIQHRGPYDTVFGWIFPSQRWIPLPDGGGGGGGAPAPPSDGSGFDGNNGGGGGGGNGYWDTPTDYRNAGVFHCALNGLPLRRVLPGGFLAWPDSGGAAGSGGFQGFRDLVGGAVWQGGFPTLSQIGSFPTNPFINTQMVQRVGQLAFKKLSQAPGVRWANAAEDLDPNFRPRDLDVPHWLVPPAGDGTNPFEFARKTCAGWTSGHPDAHAYWVRIRTIPLVGNQKWEIMKIDGGRRYFNSPKGRVDLFFEAPETDYRVKVADGVYVAFTPTPIYDPQTGEVVGYTPDQPVVYLWAGVNDPTQVATVENPNQGLDGTTFGPYDLKDEAAQPPAADALGPQSPFNFLGFAANPNKSPAWPAKFAPANYKRHVGLAQARVMNNHSWDLWTQMWHAQLTPIENYDGWVAQMQAQAGQAGGEDKVNTGELSDLNTYLTAIKPMAPLITH